MEDLTAAVLWFASNATSAVASWRLASRASKTSEWTTLLGQAILLQTAIIISIATALGAIGRLYPALLHGSTTAASLALLAVLSRGRRLDTRPELRLDPPTNSGLIALILAIAAVSSHSICSGVMSIPQDDDTLIYHLPLVDSWLQAGSCYAPLCLNWRTPGNLELVALWHVCLFSGDFFAPLCNVPFAILLLLGTLGICRELGIGRLESALTALLTCSSTIVFQQTTTVSNDVTAAGLFMIGVLHYMRFFGKKSFSDLAYASIATGLLAGTKYYALLYASGLIFAASVAMMASKTRGWRAVILAGVGSVVVFGGYWYVRNAIVAGNPIYPLGSPDPSHRNFQYGSIYRSTFLGQPTAEVLRLAIEAVEVECGPYFLAAFLCTPLLIPYLLAIRKDVGRGTCEGPGVSRAMSSATFLGFLLVVTGFIAISTPFAIEDKPNTLNALRWKYTPVRYSTIFLSLSVVGLTLALRHLARVAASRISGRRRILAALGSATPTALSILALTHNASARWNILHFSEERETFFVIALAGIFALQLLRLAPTMGRSARVAFTASALLVGCTTMALVARSASLAWHAGFAEEYDYRMHDNIIETLNNQKFSGKKLCVFERPYPFYGPRRLVEVCKFTGLDFDPDSGGFEGRLTSYLLEHDVGCVCVPLDYEGPDKKRHNLRDWFEARPNLFRKIHSGDQHFLFECVRK